MLVNKLFLPLLLISNIYASDDGLLLFNGNCTTCHHLTKSISAPSMLEVQKRYRKAFDNKNDFVKYMSTWVIKPNKETSIMLDAIDKYSLMPELAFELEVIKEISLFIYKTDFR